MLNLQSGILTWTTTLIGSLIFIEEKSPNLDTPGGRLAHAILLYLYYNRLQNGLLRFYLFLYSFFSI